MGKNPPRPNDEATRKLIEAANKIATMNQAAKTEADKAKGSTTTPLQIPTAQPNPKQ